MLSDEAAKRLHGEFKQSFKASSSLSKKLRSLALLLA
jgi:hypothetical protein